MSAPGRRTVSSQWSMPQAIRDFALTPQEQNLYGHHIYNLNNGFEVPDKDGNISTVLQAVVENSGRFYNIPTVWGGKILPVPEAVKVVEQNGGWDRWPSYGSQEEADQRYMAMHGYMDRDIGMFLGRR